MLQQPQLLLLIFVLNCAGAASGWSVAHATFYGGSDASGTMGGACGYGNMYTEGFGVSTAALSTALFRGGLSCGSCFELRCFDDPKWCWPGNMSIKVTATNFCPQNAALPSNNGGWCNAPRKHFDVSMPAFKQLANTIGGIIPVRYRRVHCHRHGGMKFTIHGNQWFVLVLVHNVGGAGDVVAVAIKEPRSSRWTAMSRNWGQNWQTNGHLVGHSISFRVTTSDGQVRTASDIVPREWKFGQTFTTDAQFS